MSDRPQLKDMVVALAGLTWDEVTLMAVQLRVDMSTLTNIEQQYSDPGVRTLRSMNSWLQSDPHASWSKIVTALRTINRLTVARAVEQQYCQSVETTASPASQPPTGPHSPPPTESVTTSAEQPSPPSDCTTAPSPPASSAISTSSPPDLASTPQPVIHEQHATSSPTSPPLSLHRDHPMPGATKPVDPPGAENGVPVQPDMARIKQVAEETSRLHENFLSVLTDTKIYLSEKQSESEKFLNRFRITLTTLPLSYKFQHLHFLRDEREKIKSAEDVDEIFDVLDDYWNWSDYYLLQRLVTKFGDDSLKQEMFKYLEELELFERATTIHLFRSAVKPQEHWKHPYSFHKAVIMLQRDPTKCTLYDIRKLKEDLTSKSSANKGAIFYDDVHVSSVVVKVVFPRDALELLPPALDAAFLEQHQIISVTIDNKPLEEYDEDYLKVNCCERTCSMH